MTVDDVMAQFEEAATEFARGDPGPVKDLYADADDVTLANPFGPPVRGWAAVSAALDHASSRFSDGVVTEIRTIARYEAPDLVTAFAMEHWRAKVGGGDFADFDLRVTTTYRREPDGWKIVHRHADPISTPDERGPLRLTDLGGARGEAGGAR